MRDDSRNPQTWSAREIRLDVPTVARRSRSYWSSAFAIMFVLGPVRHRPRAPARGDDGKAPDQAEGPAAGATASLGRASRRRFPPNMARGKPRRRHAATATSEAPPRQAAHSPRRPRSPPSRSRGDTKPASPARRSPRSSTKPGDEATSPRPRNPAVKPVSFMRDVAPILVENCIACHNPRKSESKYVMTTFAQLAKGGPAGRRHHARARKARREPPGRADPARRPAADAVQAGPAPRRRRSRPSSAGSRKGPSTTAARPARTGRSCSARPSRSRSPRRIP